MVSVRALLVIVVGLGALFVTLTSSTAHGGPFSKPASAEARNHLALGNKLYGVRDFEKAVTEYKAGALVEQTPVFDYNLGQCYRQLGKYEEAIWHYEQFLTRGNPEGEVLDAVNGFLAQMRAELEKKARTQKPTEPAPSGSPGATSSPATSQGAPMASAPASEGVAAPQQLTARASTHEHWYNDSFGWGLTGAGTIGLAVGGGLFIDASGLRADANASGNQVDYNRLKDKAHTRALFGAIVGIGGAGLVVTGIIKLAVHSETPSRGTVTEWGIVPSGSGATVFGRF